MSSYNCIVLFLTFLIFNLRLVEFNIVRATRRKVVAACDHSMLRPGAQAYQEPHALGERPVVSPAS